MLEISPRDLYADCFALCTPEATYDLRKGMAGSREHSPEDFIKKIEDPSEVTCSFKDQEDWSKNGEYDVTVVAEDADGNLALMTPEKKMPAGAEIC